MPAGPLGSPADARITVSLTNIPLLEALRYVTGLANLKFKVEPYAVSIVPQSEPTDTVVHEGVEGAARSDSADSRAGGVAGGRCRPGRRRGSGRRDPWRHRHRRS